MTDASEPQGPRSTAHEAYEAGGLDAVSRPNLTDDQEINRLEPYLGGRWLVTTQGSQHVWDLDAMTYERLPGPGRGQFDHDRTVVAIGRVEVWPAVGSCSLLFYDDPGHPHTHEQWRQSSLIRRIHRLPDSGPSQV